MIIVGSKIWITSTPKYFKKLKNEEAGYKLTHLVLFLEKIGGGSLLIKNVADEKAFHQNLKGIDA